MGTSTLPRYVLGAAILIILLIFAVKLIPTHKTKSTTHPAAKQVAENECAQQIYTKYVKDKFAAFAIARQCAFGGRHNYGTPT